MNDKPDDARPSAKLAETAAALLSLLLWAGTLSGVQFAGAAEAQAIQPKELGNTGLKTENCTAPLGIDNPNPRFMWIDNATDRGQYQTAYQIRDTKHTTVPLKAELLYPTMAG